MEHLCAIIQQNELRKAHKLEELMQQLQLQATEEELERQREEEKKKRDCVETQVDGKEGNGSVQSGKDCGPTQEERVREERGGDDQQEQQLTIKTPKNEQDCETLENCPPSETEAS